MFAMCLTLVVAPASQAVEQRHDASRLAIRITSATHFDPNVNIVSYRYLLASAGTSQLQLRTIAVPFNAPLTKLVAPAGWDMKPYKWIRLLSVSPIEEFAVLMPGQSQGGFRFESKGLPVPVQFLAQGEAELPNVDDTPPSMTEREFVVQFDIFHNSARGYVLAPDEVTIDASPARLLERLRAVLDELVARGFLGQRGIANSLQQKVDAAASAIARGDSKAGLSITQAFRSEVTAQAGKQLSTETADALTTWADVLIGKL